MEKQIKRNNNLKESILNFIYNSELNFMEEPKMVEGYVKVQEPNWDIVVEAFKYVYDDNDKLDMITPGRFIFDTCVFEISDDIVGNNRVMLSICQQLTSLFVLPINAELKKK